MTYREIETTLGISGTSIYSILHEHLTVKKICSRWIPHNLSIAQKGSCRLVERNAPKIRSSMTSWQMMYRGFTRLSPKVNSSRLYGCFKMSQIQKKLRASKQVIACFFGKTGHVAIVPLEQHTTVNSEWYTIIYLPGVCQEIRKTDHSSPRQCDLSHIGSNNLIFEHSKHRFDESSAL